MMAVNPYTEARERANRAYDEKTYKKMLVSLRYDEDADILNAFSEAKEHGMTNRECLREMFDGSGISLRKVKSVLESNGIDEDTVNKIIYELK